tara:strand:+ start:618 stop:2129 length:1512 start_codon:yes stop_codon:yes gene_type:complete
MNKKKAIVIGAGVNGLVLSNYLQKSNYDVKIIEKSKSIGGACSSDSISINNKDISFAKGATVLGMMPNFIFKDTGLSKKLKIYSPEFQKVVYFENEGSEVNIYKDPYKLQKELYNKVGERGSVIEFRDDENKVVQFIKDGYKTGEPPSIDSAIKVLGKDLVDMWIKGTARDLLNHYFTSDKTKLYMGMTVIESSPESIDSKGSAFIIPLMDSGSVFDGYWGYVKNGIWQVTEELGNINKSIGVEINISSEIDEIDSENKKVFLESGKSFDYDVLVFATDPLTPTKYFKNKKLKKTLEEKKYTGTSGKVTAFFKNKVKWINHSDDDDSLSSFKFIFSVDNLNDFEIKSQNAYNKLNYYEPGYIQVYCEGAGQRKLGNKEPFDKLIFFTKNISYDKKGYEIPEIHEKIKDTVFKYILNPEDCVKSVFLTPKDMNQEFHFPEGNIDHMMLTDGQNFNQRTFSEINNSFYNFGDLLDVFYCGAGSYPCGSVAGTAGYMCFKNITRHK